MFGGVAILFLGIGILLLWQGANFLWLDAKFNVPEMVVIGVAALSGQSEFAIGIVCGSIAVNLVVAGLTSLRKTPPTARGAWLMPVVGLLFGGISLWFAAGHHYLGIAGGIALIGIYGILLCPLLRLRQWRFNLSKIFKGICGGVMLAVGAYLGVHYQNNLAAIWGWPQSLMAIVVVAPLLAVPKIVALIKKQTAGPTLLRAAAVDITLGLGVVAISAAPLWLSQSTIMVTIPGLAVLAGITLLGSWWQQKIGARQNKSWWHAILCGLYIVYLITLFL